MHELQVRHLMHWPTGAVGGTRGGEGVERDACRAIANDMDVCLDPRAIEREDRGREDIRLHHRRAEISTAGVRREQGGGARFERSVDAELCSSDLESRASVLLSQALDPLDLGG